MEIRASLFLQFVFIRVQAALKYEAARGISPGGLPIRETADCQSALRCLRRGFADRDFQSPSRPEQQTIESRGVSAVGINQRDRHHRGIGGEQKLPVQQIR